MSISDLSEISESEMSEVGSRKSEIMIDTNTLSQADRSLVVVYTNSMRDIDTAAFLAKPTVRVGSSAKKKIWTRFKQQTDQPITDSYRALEQLAQSENPDLRELAVKAINRDTGASAELRRIGRRLKQD
jgi:hypothetical protein